MSNPSSVTFFAFDREEKVLGLLVTRIILKSLTFSIRVLMFFACLLCISWASSRMYTESGSKQSSNFSRSSETGRLAQESIKDIVLVSRLPSCHLTSLF